MCRLHNDKDVAFLLASLDELFLVFRIIAFGLDLISLSLVSSLLALSLRPVLTRYWIIEQELFPEVLGGVHSAFGRTALGCASGKGDCIIVFEVVLDVLFGRLGIVSRVCILVVSVVVLLLPPLDVQQRLRVLFVVLHCHFGDLVPPLFFLRCPLLRLLVSPLLGALPLVDIDAAELLDVQVVMALRYPFAVLFRRNVVIVIFIVLLAD